MVSIPDDRFEYRQSKGGRVFPSSLSPAWPISSRVTLRYRYVIRRVVGDLRLIHTYHAVPIPFPCRVNSHMPCRDPAILRQCRVFLESPCGRRKYPNCWSASGNNLRGTPRGSRKKPNAGRSPTRSFWAVDANSHIPCLSHAALCRGLERSLSERHGPGIAGG
jgi:hypothetical protein